MPSSLQVSCDLFAPSEPFDACRFVSHDKLHTLHFSRSGTKGAKPVFVIHGGPGAGSSPKHRQFFNPDHWDIVQLDQRGCGESTPLGLLEHNDTDHLIEDSEQLRKLLGFKQVTLWGGSWGSFLALASALEHPDTWDAMVLRAVCFLDDHEMDFSFKPGGASMLYPERFDYFRKFIPGEEQHDLSAAYYKRLVLSDDPQEHRQAAKRWMSWMGIQELVSQERDFPVGPTDIAGTRMESLYFHQRGFRRTGFILDEAPKLRGKEVRIVQGRHDMLCPPFNAWRLHRALPESKLALVEDGAHMPYCSGMRRALLSFTSELVSH